MKKCVKSVAVLSLWCVLAIETAVGMVFPDSDWIEKSPESQGVDSGKLNSAMDYLASKSGGVGVNEVVVIRNGLLIWKGKNIDRKHKVYSVSKMFLGTIYGLAVDDKLCTLNDLAKDYESRLDSSFSQYKEIQLRHFLSHTSGYDAVGGTYHTDKEDGSDTPWAPAAPHYAAGTKYGYWDDAVNMSGIVWTRITRANAYSFFRSRISDPIGIPVDKFSWPTEWVVDGIEQPNYAGGVEITARECARIGHLFLNRGSWDGRQLISKSWLDVATTNQVPASLHESHYSAADCRGMHGYHWWLNGARPSGRRTFPDAPYDLFFTVGTGHNMLFVIPEWDMVIIRLGTDFPPPTVEQRLSFWNTVLAMIGESFTAWQ